MAVGVGSSSAERRLVAYVVAAGGEPPDDERADRVPRRPRCPTTWCPRSTSGSTSCRSPRTARSTATRCPPRRRGRRAAAPRRRRGRRPRSRPTIAAVVAELLEVDEVGADQNFFLLGGHSMLGAQLIVRLEDLFGVEISLRYLFDHPTPAAIAAEVERQIAAGDRRRGDRVSAGTAGSSRAAAAQPLPPARPGGAGRSVPALPAAARGGPGALGSLPARLGGHPLRRRGHGAAPLPRRPHAGAGAAGALGMGELAPIAARDGAPDAVPRPARRTAACAGWPRRPSRRAASRGCASTSEQIAERPGRRRSPAAARST